MQSQILSGLQNVAPVSFSPIELASSQDRFQTDEAVGLKDILDVIYSKVLAQILPPQVTNYSKIAIETSSSNQVCEVPREIGFATFAHYLKHYDQAALSPASRQKEAIDLKRRYQALFQRFQSEQRFMQFMMNSARCTANSLAFYQVFRLSHDQFNAHALQLNGQIVHNGDIDFEQTGENQHLARDLFSRSLCYFNSFNKTELSNTALIEFFDQTFLEHKRKLNVTLMGLDGNDFVSPMFKDLLRDNTNEINECYTALNDKNANVEDRLFHFVIAKFCETEPQSASSTLLHHAHNLSQSHLLLSSHILNASIKSLRKICFSKAFCQSNVRTLVDERLTYPSGISIANVIEQYEATAAWLFDRKDTYVHTIVFSNATLQCYYVPITSSFVIEHFVKGHKYAFLTVKELLIYLRSQAKTDFNLPGFLGWEALFMLLQALLQIEFSWRNTH